MSALTGIRPTGSTDAGVAALLRLLLRRALKPVLTASVPIERQRRRMDRLARLAPPARGVRFRAATVGGVPGEWAEPTGSSLPPPAAGRLLWLHGGAYCTGSPRTHRPLTGALARHSGLPVFVPDYRLAPEHPFPAALDDASATLAAMTAQGPVVVGGDSAGGGLALAVAMAARDSGHAPPAALLLADPWSDPGAGATGSPALDAVADAVSAGTEPCGEVLLNTDWGRQCAAAYAGAAPVSHPSIAPLRADLRYLPPVLLQVTTDQWLYDQGLQLREALLHAGVPVRTEVIARRWHVFQVHAGLLPSATAAVARLAGFARDALGGRVPAAEPDAVDRREVVVLGAGVSGLVIGRALRAAGIHDFEIVEKSQGLGGTWWDNRYPGAQVDVPAPLYSLRTDPYERWTHRYADASEIQRYLQRVALRHGLIAHLRLGDALVDARFDAARERWVLRTDLGRVLSARWLVLSTGPLNQPRWPDIPGLVDFTGERLHSARWPTADAAAIDGRRVAVIGTGPTAAQLIPAVASRAAHLSVFQRTASWVLPRTDRRYGPLDRALMRIPGLNRLPWRFWYRFLEFGRPGLDEGRWLHRLLTRIARRHLASAVPDPALRLQLTPPHPLGCKRLVYSNDYFPTFARPGVALVTTPIARITARGIVTADGREHPVDTLVCATGFQTTAPLGSVTVARGDGRLLADEWHRGLRSWHGVMLPGWPNLFLLLGPNTGTGHTSTIPYIEAQADFVVKAIAEARARGAHRLAVRETTVDAFDARLQGALAGSVWTRCTSWYRAPDGRITAIWPFASDDYRRALARPDWAGFDIA